VATSASTSCLIVVGSHLDADLTQLEIKKDMKVYLIGYRGSGKTTVGRLLSEQLGWAFIDTDAEIESSAGIEIRKLFEESGEETFRQLETKAIQNTIDLKQTVISLGGGACQKQENQELINRPGSNAIWLTGDAETLWQRISDDGIANEKRPNLTGLEGLEEVKQLLDRRHENYAACADYKIDTRELPPDQVAAEIAKWLQTVDKN